MKHRLILCVILAVLLSSCAQREHLPAKEVLSRSAQRNQSLNSASFTIDAKYEYDINRLFGMGKGEARIEGTLQDGGKQVSLLLDADAESLNEDSVTKFNAVLEMIVTTPGEMYLKVHELASEPGHPLLAPDMIGLLLNKWWILPSDGSQAPDLMLTPNPELIKAQSEVVRVTSDRGFDRIVGRRAYHYDIELDPGKLESFIIKMADESGEEFDQEKLNTSVSDLDAKGELWVDAEKFDMLRLSWKIVELPVGDDGSVSISFTMELSDHNIASPIELPRDARPFMQLDAFSLNEGSALPSDWEEELIKKLLEGDQDQFPEGLDEERLKQIMEREGITFPSP